MENQQNDTTASERSAHAMPGTATTMTASGSFSAGAVISRTIETLMKNPVVFFGLSIAASLLPLLFTFVLPASSGTMLFTAVLGFVLGLVIQGAVAYTVYQILIGKNASIGDSVQRGLARAMPVFIASVLAGVGVMLGMVLLVVPGLILICMWYVAIPVCVVEKKGALDSLQRSAYLTKGNRLLIFGLVVLVGIVILIINGLTALIFIPLLGSVGQVLLYLFGAVPQAFSAVMTAIIYYELRCVKDGVTLDSLADVFD